MQIEHILMLANKFNFFPHVCRFHGNDVTVQNSLKSAVHLLSGNADLETIWVIGGSSVYKVFIWKHILLNYDLHLLRAERKICRLFQTV